MEVEKNLSACLTTETETEEQFGGVQLTFLVQVTLDMFKASDCEKKY